MPNKKPYNTGSNYYKKKGLVKTVVLHFSVPQHKRIEKKARSLRRRVGPHCTHVILTDTETQK